MPLVPDPKGCDISVKRAIQGLSKKLGYTSSPTFAGTTYTGLTASRLVTTDANKKLASVANLASWVAGTANEIDITNDGDGTITVGIINPLIVGKGGIGTASLTDHSLLAGSGTNAITALGVAANGQLPIGSTGADPTLATITGTSNQVNIANAAGSITLSTPQDIATDSYPLFINTNSALSSMILTGGVISAGTDAGTIKVAALTAMLRTDTGALDNLTRITLAEQDNITLAAADTYYNVLLTYGDPCTIATSTSSGNGANIIGIGHCLKETDGTRHYADAGLRLTDGIRKLHNRASKLRKIEKSTGVLVSETGTRNLYITAGTFHRGINSYDFTLKDTSDTDTFDYYYYNPTTSAWVKDDNSGSHYTQIDIVQYNKIDSGTGLDNLVANKYTTNWIFVHPDDEHILVVYGRSNSTLTAAENENIPPSLPDVIDKLAVLLCKIIVRATTGALVFENVEYFSFTPEIAVDHNELQGLQGGTTDEYYHLTSAEHTLISAVGGLTPTNSNFIVGNGSTWVAEAGDTVRTSLGLAIGANVQAHSDALDDLTNVGTVTGDSYFLVGTGAAVLAWETTTTARTSIGLGTGNSPTFTGLNLTGMLTIDSAAALILLHDSGTNVGHYLMSSDTTESSGYGEFSIWRCTGAAGSCTLGDNPPIFWADSSLNGYFPNDITADNYIIRGDGTVGQATGPLLTFDNTNDNLEITGCDTYLAGSLFIHKDEDWVSMRVGESTTKEGGFYWRNELERVEFACHSYNYPMVFNGVLRVGVQPTYYVGITTDEVLPNAKLSIGGTIKIQERASAIADSADYGQMWVKSDTPNTLWFTNDGGTDYQIGGALNSVVIAGNGTVGQAAGPLMTFDDTNDYLEITGCDVGIGPTAPTAKLEVEGSVNPVFRGHRLTSATNTIVGGFRVGVTSSGNMADGFGPTFAFEIGDDTQTRQEIAQLAAYRDGADNSGAFSFRTVNAGAGGERMKIAADGTVFMYNLASGTDQANAGAAANELFRRTTDNVIMIGV